MIIQIKRIYGNVFLLKLPLTNTFLPHEIKSGNKRGIELNL